MDKYFVPYEQALALKELGFDEPCLAWYPVHEVLLFMGMKLGSTTPDFVTQNSPWIQSEKIKTCIAPTFSQAFGWFRENFHIHGEPFYKGGLTKETSWYDYKIYSNIDWEEDKIQYKTYEEAELECLKKLIEIVKEN